VSSSSSTFSPHSLTQHHNPPTRSFTDYELWALGHEYTPDGGLYLRFWERKGGGLQSPGRQHHNATHTHTHTQIHTHTHTHTTGGSLFCGTRTCTLTTGNAQAQQHCRSSFSSLLDDTTRALLRASLAFRIKYLREWGSLETSGDRIIEGRGVNWTELLFSFVQKGWWLLN
jgi:hypothetical protein